VRVDKARHDIVAQCVCVVLAASPNWTSAEHIYDVVVLLLQEMMV